MNIDGKHVAVAVRRLGLKDAPGFTADFRVDPTVWNSVVPGSMLKEIGIKPDGRQIFQTADGELEEYEYAFGEMAFCRRKHRQSLTAWPRNTEPIPGLLALHGAGFIVDSTTKTVTKLRARPLKPAFPRKIPLAA